MSMRRFYALLFAAFALFVAQPSWAIGGTSSSWSGWARRNWQPKDAGGVTLVAHLNAAAAEMTLVSATHVSTWADQSGHGNNGEQTIDAVRLIYNATGGPDNLPWVAFDPVALSHVTFGAAFAGLSAGEVLVVRKASDPASGVGLDVGSFWSFGTSVSTDAVPFSDGVIYDGFGSTTRQTAGNPATSLAN